MMSTDIEDLFNYLWLEYAHTCFLLRIYRGKLHGCAIPHQSTLRDCAVSDFTPDTDFYFW